jgi:hypothetical protein
MMFVSVMSTSAFAAYDHQTQRRWRDAGQLDKIMDALKTNVENMYGTMAANTAVFNGVKSIDDMMTKLVDEMMKGYAPSGFGTRESSTTISDAIKAGLRATIGGEITHYLSDHVNDYYHTNSTGVRIFDPVAYANAFAKAATGAVASEKAVKGIQSYMYYILQRSAFEQLSSDANDLANRIASFSDYSAYGFTDGTVPAGWDITVLTNILNNVNAPIDTALTGVNPAVPSAGGMLLANLDNNNTGFDGNGDGKFEPLYNSGIDGLTWDTQGNPIWTEGYDALGNVTNGVENAVTPEYDVGAWVTGVPAFND